MNGHLKKYTTIIRAASGAGRNSLKGLYSGPFPT
jgi:hypothetical protein